MKRHPLILPASPVIMRLIRCAILLLAVVCGVSPLARADVRLPAIISDHMVLQRDAEVAIWGWADVGEEVTVSIAGQKKTAKGNGSGKWLVRLEKLPAGRSFDMTVRGRNEIIVRDVLVGEVWLASGQSNMQMAMSATEDFASEQEAARYPLLRMFSVIRDTAREPRSDCEGEWVACSPDTVASFSGTAYYFGRDLHRQLGLPVGVIHSSQGGSPIEAWTSLEAQQSRPELKPMLASWEGKDRMYDAAAALGKYEETLAAWKVAAQKAEQEGRRPPTAPKKPVHPRDDYHHPTVLFNAMIAPLIPYTLRGVIWYQGESNGHSEAEGRLYATQLPLLIADWRERWGQGEFPFAWVQLPNYNASGRSWPFIRESMLQALAVTNTGMAIAIDIGSTNTIHPRNKRDVGGRLALWARAKVYGEDVAWSGPLPAGQALKGREIELRFAHADGGLESKGDALRGFEVLGADDEWKPAAARIQQDKVVVSRADGGVPMAVRYSWHSNPNGNLFNRAGLPATPFRTDKLKNRPGQN